ncbi:MAG: thiamine-phosphate kinase [Planctomycetota bacterium]|nr:thiamine-phosphate kinase [Planctomycetota bacterium]
MTWSEDSLHRWLAEQPWPAGLAGSRGHDAAVLDAIGGRLAFCADQCIEGVHFRSGVDPGRAGRKAVLRCLSDLAAARSLPVAVTLTLSAEAAREERDLRALLLGARAAAAEHGAELVAGDLACAAGRLLISVSALGEVHGDEPPPGRDRARPGQGIYLSGPVGGSGFEDRHLEPTPRFDLIDSARGASAMMDVSDGLAWDLHRLLRASGCGGRIELDGVPVHPDALAAASGDTTAALDAALHDGEDHELIATADATLPAPWVRVGVVTAGKGLLIASESTAAISLAGPWVPVAGKAWSHGDPRG